MSRAQTNGNGRKAETFRKLLVAKKTELLGSLDEARFDTLARMGRVAEEDQAQISHEEFISLSRNSMEYDTLRQVEEALDRVDAGDYGTCEACEEPISEKRLQVLPWARYCVSCQQRAADSPAFVPELAGSLW